MKVVITGPTGAIGHALIEECLNHGDEVLAICHASSLRKKTLPNSERLQIVSLDLSNFKNASVQLNKFNSINGMQIDKDFDVFYHLAWSGTVGEERNNKQIQERNCEWALDAVDLAKSLGCKKFIGAGSQAEFGRFEGALNSDVPTNPENEYGKAKLKSSGETRALCEKYGISHIWVRVLSVYGPFDGERSMIISSLRKMLSNEKTFFTKGEQFWDYLYSKDAGRAFRLLGFKGNNGKIYVLGSGKARKLKEYINIMAEQTGYSDLSGIGVIDYSDKQVMYLKADITELSKDTGFIPITEFEEGIKETIEYVKYN